MSCCNPRLVQSSTFACPIEAMADGLHAMAQSLTVLRGALGACKLQGSEEAKVERYLEMATKHSGTMNDLFSGLRATLDSADGKVNLEKVDLGELIRFVVKDMDHDLRECGSTVAFIELDSPVQILGDAEKTERAIRAALRLVSSDSTRKGEVLLSIRPSKGQVELIIETNSNRERDLGFNDRLNLSLIESNIQSQGGRHKYVENPLAVLISLPAYRPESEESVHERRSSETEVSTSLRAAGPGNY